VIESVWRTENDRHVLKRAEGNSGNMSLGKMRNFSGSQDGVGADKACRHTYGQQQWPLLQ